ncbi:MAG: hypothetical protein K0U84_20115 [Actinomycetia bacterium]|nr:hypothetical protein [Actinomycetes bacterium]
MSALDSHVVIAAAAGTFTVAGEKLTGPVDSVDKLGTLIAWAHERGGLQPVGSAAQDTAIAGRLWLVGAGCEQLLGPLGETADLREPISHVLAPLVAGGWELRPGPSSGVTVARGRGKARLEVQILAEPDPWLAGGSSETAEDVKELGRRLSRWHAAIGVLPEASGPGSGAVLAEHIMAVRERGAVVDTPAVLPSRVRPERRIQPSWCASAEAVEEAFEASGELARLTQQCPQLASAGMVMLGHGTPEVLDAAAAVAAASSSKRPFGLWRVSLPAATALTLPARLPFPHPLMCAQEPTPAWVTTEDLVGLTKAVRDGGAAVSIGQLAVEEAIVWPQQSRVLEAWAKRMREAREAFAQDAALQELVESAAAEYITGLGEGSVFGAESRHHQPAWAAAISSHIRFRGRRKAMRISREYRLWPLYAEEGTTIYAPGREETTGAVIDLSDTDTTRLGRLVTTTSVPLRDETVLAVLLAESDAEVAEALTSAVGLASAASLLPEHNPAAAGEDANGTGPPATGTGGATESVTDAAGDQGRRPSSPAAADGQSTPVRARGSSRSKKPSGGTLAAVLHTDGLWLPDGSCVQLTKPITHLGQVAALALEHKLGYQLTTNYAEPGQIWITAAACQQFGIDVSAIEKYDAVASLRRITEGIDFVALAAAQGWRIAAGEDNTPRMGAWTRVYRDDKDKVGVLVALIPGMGSEADMPVLAGEPTPAQIARRVQLFADALGFPWKVGAGTTAIDLMLHSRPKTYSWQQWKEVVFAPSTHEAPYSLPDVERDYNWTRKPTTDELACAYVHAYDRGASYPAAIAGLELPIGAPTHHSDGATFDKKTPGYWLIDVPEQGDWRLPYLLNPTSINFTGPKWTTTPRLERAIALGYEPKIHEAWIWEEHGRVLNGWYERLRDASVSLDIGDPDALAARQQTKVVRTRGIGLLGSETYLKGSTGYSPERRFHIMAKANANIVYLCNEIGQRTDRWPVAVHTDTVLYVSDIADPIAAWPGDPAKLGTGFGQYKPEGSALLSDHGKYLDGGAYRGKGSLTDPQDWPEVAQGAQAART